MRSGSTKYGSTLTCKKTSFVFGKSEIERLLSFVRSIIIHRYFDILIVARTDAALAFHFSVGDYDQKCLEGVHLFNEAKKKPR